MVPADSSGPFRYFKTLVYNEAGAFVYNPTPERLLAWDLVSTIIQQGFMQ